MFADDFPLRWRDVSSLSRRSTAPLPSGTECQPKQQDFRLFWYTHVRRPNRTFSSIVILEGCQTNSPSISRKIELIADLLANTLTREGRLVDVYEFLENEAAVPVS